MFKKIVFASCLLAASVGSYAGVLSHSGYVRDSGSNIVKGGGLEWLTWDTTKGMSVSTALQHYASEGWAVASNQQMATLLNAFDFGKTDWRADGQNWQTVYTPWTQTETSHHNAFLDLFGRTFQTTNICTSIHVDFCFYANDSQIYSYAFFGIGISDSNKFNLAHVTDDFSYVGGNGALQRGDYSALLYADSGLSTVQYDHVGVALVRPFKADPTPVNAPTSLGLLTLAFIALGVRRRQL